MKIWSRERDRSIPSSSSFLGAGAFRAADIHQAAEIPPYQSPKPGASPPRSSFCRRSRCARICRREFESAPRGVERLGLFRQPRLPARPVNHKPYQERGLMDVARRSQRSAFRQTRRSASAQRHSASAADETLGFYRRGLLEVRQRPRRSGHASPAAPPRLLRHSAFWGASDTAVAKAVSARARVTDFKATQGPACSTPSASFGDQRRPSVSSASAASPVLPEVGRGQREIAPGHRRISDRARAALRAAVKRLVRPVRMMRHAAARLFQ